MKHGSRQYHSDLLCKVWPYGLTSVGDVTFESAAYIARYCFKKQLEKKTYGGLQPEFTFMSLKPGIGLAYAEKFHKDFVSAHQCVTMKGVYKIPRYYEKTFSPAELLDLQRDRLAHVEELTHEELIRKSEFLYESFLKSHIRGYEV